MAAEGDLEDTPRTEGEQENTQASEEPIVTRMIGICAPQVNSERNIRRLRHEALASRPPLLRTELLAVLDTSTEEDAEGMDQGEIEYLGTEVARDAVGEAVVDGDAVREEEEETL